ncbi:MAG: OmpA family protein [Candidatus Koribacter versatilis]|uniref:OmpA family protein n=1 Tax=Candidatus Korobacter versatilis TaxID=658062 RepID=A0A932A982_9BACT|nr:OmpA family protein [Candidatus Koribacter versatilis]
MKKSYLLALPLAGLLAVPSLAQSSMPQPPPQDSQAQTSQPAQPSASQNNSAPASQSVSNAPQNDQNFQSTQTASASTTSTATGKEPLKVETREGFWGHLNPFARKKYVQRQLSPVKDRVNELDQLTAENSRMIKDTDARAQEGIRVATLKATEADQHAIDAGNRAALAHQTATQASTRLQTVETVVTNLDQYQAANELEIKFRPGQSVLSKRAKDALDDVAESMKDQKGYIVEVQGFSSGSGAAALANSQKMAQAVVRYLVINHEVPVYRVYTVGMGNAKVTDADGKVVRTRGGRVEVRLLKNGIADLQQSASMAAPPSSSVGSNQQGGVSGSISAQPQQNNMQQQPSSTAAPASNQPPPQPKH